MKIGTEQLISFLLGCHLRRILHILGKERRREGRKEPPREEGKEGRGKGGKEGRKERREGER